MLALAAARGGPGRGGERRAEGLDKALPFVADDYAKALAQAREKKLPLLVEAWAPWCHTCRSMKAYVFTDRSLARFAPQFVWLAVDTEKPKNAAVKGRLGVSALPTFYVIDPGDESVVMRWGDGMTVAELARVLDEGRAPSSGPCPPPPRRTPSCAPTV